MELSLLGLSAAPDPVNPAVPKNTPTALRVAVRSGVGDLALADVVRFLGPDFEIRGELAGPGLSTTVPLTQPAPGSSLLLPLPALTTAGTYAISNLRIVSSGRTVLDVTPSHVDLQVISQVLITSVVTRPLTLQEIKDKGIVLEKDDVIGFDFTLALKLESTPVQVTFPVIFDRTGVPVPTGITPPMLIERANVDVPTIVPMMLSVEDGNTLMPRPMLKLPDGRVVEVKIPALLVIPGNTGYLKQFFSAQLHVQNGAPSGTNLIVRNIAGTIMLPTGDDALPHTPDDPLSLPATKDGPQPETQAIHGVGPDGIAGTADDPVSLTAGETGQAEFLLRGDREGFHPIGFDINATLDGLATGSIPVRGHASGGVLVRNPYFDVTFTAPSVVRTGERFTLNMTLTNIGQGAANALTVALDASRMSGTHVAGAASQAVDTIAPGDSKTLKFTFVSDRTGQVVAHYLRFDPLGAAATGQVNFTVGVGERGVPLSPDTLVLPAVVDNLPTDVVDAAMRVLGQAWSIAGAPAGTLPPSVIRTTKTGVTHKALALAEAGLRMNLGQTLGDALRDLGVDFYGGSPLDNGFDQLLRQTDAGRGFAVALGAALSGPALEAGGASSWQRALADVAASGPDLLTFTVADDVGSAPADLALTDASGHRTTTLVDAEAMSADIRSAALLPLGAAGSAPIAGFVTAPTASPYTLSWTAAGAGGSIDLSMALPRGDGTVARGTISSPPMTPGTHARVVMNTARADSVTLDEDADGDGVYEASVPLAIETLAPSGPRALAAAVIGPEIVAGAQPFGFNMAILFDRATDAASAADAGNFQIPSNTVLGPHRQLSGRLVFASLARPEGPYVPTTVAISGISDTRGATGPAATLPLMSRLRDPGAVIRGRVIAAGGTPVSSGVVTYQTNRDYTCVDPQFDAFSAIALGVDGRFEFRYVRQDVCGLGWILSANDPVTGALREVVGSVRTGGEQIEADIVLFGRGHVSGIVRDLLNRPVPGATVVAVSATDPQSGGKATTDGDGRYTIYGLTVGVVNVRAAKGISGGRTTGNIPRAGDTGTANLTLDGGTVNVSGIVRKVDGATTAPLGGAVVVYYLRESTTYTAVGVTKTRPDGSYDIPALPVGPFRIEAFINAQSKGSVEGVAAAGDTLVRDVAIVIETGVTVRGRVVMPDASPATDTVVYIDQRGVTTGADGSFAIPGVPARPYAQTVRARTRDGLRTGQTSVTINDSTQQIPDLLIALSGLGSVDLLVVDPLGTPLVNQEVAIIVPCARLCDCALRIGVTGSNGRVRFDGLPIGSATASAVRLVKGFGDQADLKTSIPRDGVVVFGVLRFPGFGMVTGTVLDPGGQPTEGADVSLQSNSFANSCSLSYGASQKVRTDVNGQFRFTSVNLGRVGVTATHPFFNTTTGASSTLTANGQQVDLTLRLTDTIAGQLSGTIFLPDGTTPVGAGVKVSIRGQLPEVIVSTDDQGHYQLAKIFPQGGYRITASDPVTGGIGYEDIYLSHGQDAIHNVRLKGQGTVRVHVVDGANQPVESAFVTLRETAYPSRVFEASLDASNQGVATFEHVFEGGFSLKVTDAFGRGARPSATLPGPGQTIDVKARLTTTGTVRGRFFAADHVTPVPYGVVQLLEYYRYGVIGQVTAEGMGDVGSYEFTHVPAGLIRIRAQDPLTGRTGLGVGTLTTEGEVINIDVFAQGIGMVHGLVTSNGAPQPGAHVTVVSGRYSAGTLTDADGNYLVGGVPEGPVTSAASLGNGFLQGTASATLAGDGTDLAVDVALRNSGSIDGQLFEADGTTTGPISVITAQSGGFGGGTQSVTTELSGAFHFPRVPAGLVTLSADVVGSIDQATLSAEVPVGAAAAVTFTLNGVGRIDGVARDSSGQVIAGAITITGTGAARYSATATAAIDGSFHLTEVLAGPFTAALRATVNGLTLYGSASGVVTPNQTTALTVQLQDTGTVAGLVLRPDGTTPAVGAAVTIRLDRSRGTLDVQTQADGRFTVTGVPLGGLDVSVFDPGSNGVGRVINQQLAHNGDTADAGTIVLDNQPFSVVSIDPADGSTNVLPTHPITIALSAAADLGAGLRVLDETGQSLGFGRSLSPDGKTITICCNLLDGRDLTVQLDTALRDVYGRHLLSTVTSHFRTRDVTLPAVVSVTPAHQTIQVPVTGVVTVTFSEPLSTANLSTVITGATAAGVAAPGTTVMISPTQAVFTPNPPLAPNTVYLITISGATDLTGNRQNPDYHASFSTTDTTPPATSRFVPSDGQLTTVRTPTIQWTFDAGVSGANVATGRMLVDGVVVAASRATTAITFTPTTAMSDGLHTVQASMSDVAGNVATVSWSFTIDSTPPSVPAILGVSEGQILSGPIGIGASAVDATSAVVRYDVQIDSFPLLTLNAPAFSGTFNTVIYMEGAHTLTARAVDAAGNASAYSAPVHVIVDNKPLTVVSFSAPLPNTRFKDSATVTVSTSEPVDHLTFTAGTTTITATALNPTTYSGVVPFSTAPEGTIPITATAYGLVGDVATKSLNVIVDRTPPPILDITRIDAEPPTNGVVFVTASAGATEGGATIRATNTANGATASANTAANGSFGFSILASSDDVLSITATDAVGNQSGATLVVVRQVAALQAPVANASLHFEGVLVDRVGAASGAIAPDGALDAVFTFNLTVGDNVTRTLSSIDLAGPVTRSTRSGVGGALGVAADAGGTLLNNADGTVGFPIATATSLTLFAADSGFIQNGATYTATAAFTDGSRFVALFAIPFPEDRSQVAHSLDLFASPSSTVTGTPAAPGFVTLTLNNIRDIDGSRVPDGAKVGIAVADGASTDPRGGLVHSAGGLIVDGTTSANKPAFKVFTIQGGTVTATYSTGSLTPTAISGATAVVQVMPVDASDNVIGTETIGTIDLMARHPGDQALITATPTTVYADRADRRVHLVVQVRDAAGHAVANGTNVAVSLASCATRLADFSCAPASYGGQIIGGFVSPNNSSFRVFTVGGGTVAFDYSPSGVILNTGSTAIVDVQVTSATATGAIPSTPAALGTTLITLVSAGASEVSASAATLPIVYPNPAAVQVLFHHVHDMRGHLAPDGATFLVSAASCATRTANGSCVTSAGGTILDGATPPNTAFRSYPLTLGQIIATYSSGTLTLSTGQTAVATVQLAMADVNGNATSTSAPALALKTVVLTAPSNAVGIAQPSTMLADGGAHASTITFSPVVDAYGNTLPEGSLVLASAGSCAARYADTSCIPSVGGQILEGTASPSGAAYKVVTVHNGGVTVTYTDQNIGGSPGQIQTANVMLIPSTSTGGRSTTLVQALGTVSVTLAGMTSATGSVSPNVLYGDGIDRRATVTVTDIRDALGNPVPDGTVIAASAASCAARKADQSCVNSYGGAIIGGTAVPNNSYFRAFTVQNGQVVFQYASQVNGFSTGQKTVNIAVVAAKPDFNLVTASAPTPLATVSLTLISALSGSISVTPSDLFLDWRDHVATVVISNLVGSDGVTPVPDGARVGLSIDKGILRPAGVTPGDGSNSISGGWTLYTVAGGEVHLGYSDLNVQPGGVNTTTLAHISVAPTTTNGQITATPIATATVRLHAMTSATASGPATLVRSGGTTTGTVTFSGIKDSAGNTVPDGTLVAVTAQGLSVDPITGASVSSVGGTIVDGGNSIQYGYRVFTVMNGSITVTYSTSGASAGTARVVLLLALLNTAPAGNQNLIGGVWAITVQ